MPRHRRSSQLFARAWLPLSEGVAFGVPAAAEQKHAGKDTFLTAA